jgi:4-amino-4-deoxy-L-arabinose transferase-like glycosyltransferase
MQAHAEFLLRLTQGLRPYLLLVVLGLGLYLPGLTAIPPLDRDEARFAQASRQMLESGDLVSVRFQSEIRAKKPVGIYWMQAAAARLSGEPGAIWPYRVPSVLGALAAILLTFHFGQSLAGRPGALVGAALLASCFLLVSEAHQAKTDAVLLACVVAAQGAMGRFYMAGQLPFAGRGPIDGPIPGPPPGWRTAAIFWVAQGIGFLIKGPIIALISALTILALWAADRRISWVRALRPLAGLALFAVIVGPWAYAVSHATGGQFFGQAIKTDLLPKLLGGQEGHGSAPGTHLALLTGMFWPASLFVVPAVWHAFKRRQSPALRFCLAWVGPAWIVFELIPTKLPHYVLPLYPALALLTGAILAHGHYFVHHQWIRIFARGWGMAGFVLAMLIILAPVRLATSYPWWVVPLAELPLATGILPAMAVWRGQQGWALMIAIGGAVLTFAGVFQLVLPSLDRMWVSQHIADKLPAGTPIAAAGYHEPSLVFLMGTKTLLTDGIGAAQFLATTENGVAVVEDAKAEPDFRAGLAENHTVARIVGRIDGIDYTHARPIKLTLWRREPTP